MTIILVGLDYHTAPLALREKLYVTGDTLTSALQTLQQAGLAEVIILSTCNRLEVFAVTDDPQTAAATITGFLAESAPVYENLENHIYCYEQSHAVEHLMRVAAGLESLVIGESQILGQVVQALQSAQKAFTCGPTLSKLFTAAIHTGKRSRTETGISRNTLSVSHTAAFLIQEQMKDELTKANVVVVGAGEMGKQAAHALKMHGFHSISILNRTYATAEYLAARLGIRVLPWEELASALINADAVITTASVTQPFIDKHLMSAVMKARGYRPLILIDIGVPRNVDHDIHELDGVQLYDIDHLRNIVDHNREQRKEEAQVAHAIIQQELLAFNHWLNTREIVPLITELRHNTQSIAQAEVERALRRLPALDEQDQEVIYELAHRIINKVLHTPTVAIKSRAAYGDHHAYSHAVRQLFALDIQSESQNPKANRDE